MKNRMKDSRKKGSRKKAFAGSANILRRLFRK